jgi:hypothetical protein
VTLIPEKNLQEAHAKFEQDQAADVTMAKPAFVYKPRVTLPVYKKFGAVPVAVPVAAVVKATVTPVVTTAKAAVTPVASVAMPVKAAPTQDANDYTGRKTKKGKQVCICGHQYDQHCSEPPLQHWPASEGSYGFFFCISTHCEGFNQRDESSVPCDCWAFRATADEIPTMKRRKADDFTPCASCAHLKNRHCKPSRKAPLPGTYQGFSLNGEPYVCKHGPSDSSPWYTCSSASCAEEGCGCSKYRNPLLKPSAPKRSAKAPAAKPTAPRIARAELARKAEILVEVVREDPTLSVAELAEASERPAPWVRSTLKKAGITLGKTREKSAFTTGQGVLPAAEAKAESDVNP